MQTLPRLRSLWSLHFTAGGPPSRSAPPPLSAGLPSPRRSGRLTRPFLRLAAPHSPSRPQRRRSAPTSVPRTRMTFLGLPQPPMPMLSPRRSFRVRRAPTTFPFDDGASLEVMSSTRPPCCARTHVARVPLGSPVLRSFFLIFLIILFTGYTGAQSSIEFGFCPKQSVQ